MWSRLVFTVLATTLVQTTHALDLSKTRVNGFSSVGLALHNEDGYDYAAAGGGDGIESDVNFKTDSVVGLQLYTPLADDLDLTLQMVANGRFDFEPDVEWAYMGYQLADNWKIRAGRLRAPLFLYSESLDVGYSYNWARPPEEVYNLATVNNYDGVDIAYMRNLGDWDFGSSLYIGTSFVKGERLGSGVDFELERVAGLSFTLANEYVTFRIGHTQGVANFGASEGLTAAYNANLAPTLLSGQADALVKILQQNPNATGASLNAGYQKMFSDMSMLSADIQFSGVGVMVDYHDWLLNSELVRRVSGGFPADHEAGYLMLGKRIDDFTPTITFAYIRQTNPINAGDYAILPYYGADGIAAVSANIQQNLINTGASPEVAAATAAGAAQLLTGTDAIYSNAQLLNNNFQDEQDSITLGLRWDITTGVAMKTEYKRIKFQNDTPGYSYPSSDYAGQKQPDGLDVFSLVFDMAF